MPWTRASEAEGRRVRKGVGMKLAYLVRANNCTARLGDEDVLRGRCKNIDVLSVAEAQVALSETTGAE